jgi:hypothetical protein
MVGHGMLAPALVKRLLGCRVKPAIKDVLAASDQRLRDPGEVDMPDGPFDASFDVAGSLSLSTGVTMRRYRAAGCVTALWWHRSL